MRLLDQERNLSTREFLMLLTYSEACELRDDLERVIQNKKSADHIHLNDESYQHELTISLYDEDNLEDFQDRIKKLIQNDE